MTKHVTVVATPAHRQKLGVMNESMWEMDEKMINAWLLDNVHTMADARRVLGSLIAAVSHLVKQERKRT